MIFRSIKTLLGVAAFVVAAALFAGSDGMKIEDVKFVKAGHWSIVGKNIFAEDQVHLPLGEYELYADKVIVNTETQDIEAVGDIRFYRWRKISSTVTPAQLATLQQRSGIIIKTDGLVGDEWGNQKISITALVMSGNLSAQRMTGNLKTGYFRFDKIVLKMDMALCRADWAERFPNGTVEVNGAEFSSCEYLQGDNAHYAVAAANATLTPYASDLPGLEGVKTDAGDYSILCANGIIKIYGVPVFWLPAFYVPRDQPLGLFGFQVGKNGDWGYYLKMFREFNFYDYPEIRGKLMVDLYDRRGVGVGFDGSIVMENSRTNFFAYTIYDRHPDESTDYYKYWVAVPHYRYDLRLSNVTHITPRLDFRGVIEYASDPFFTRDFFNSRYSADSQPATYAALEQQFDHFSASIYFRPRINDFYTVVEKMPEVRIDVHRQEIFDTNLYYQGNMTAGYDRMRWINFTERPGTPGVDFTDFYNYSAFRFDMTHFLYYPIKTDYFTIVPRAGVNLTTYSNSSENPVDDENLLKMFAAANDTNTTNYFFENFDNKGGAQVRFAWELGVEASTKIHNTWRNVRSEFLGIDGLRHVMRPYINYTYLDYICTTDRENLYYFDEKDRLQRQNFIRFGLENRLQTRSGNQIVNLLSMENYWDFYFSEMNINSQGDTFSRFGNICTLLTFQPIKQLTLSTMFAIDPSNVNGDIPDTIRQPTSPGQSSYNAGKTGLNCKWLNRWIISISFTPIQDVNLTVSYVYNRPYATRSSYSMGSTLTQFDAGGLFTKYYTDHNERITGNVTLPLTPDRRTFGGFQIDYDFVRGYISRYGFFLRRRFHCIDVIASFSLDRNTDVNEKDDWDKNFSIQAQLVNLGLGSGYSGNEMLNVANQGFTTPDPLGAY